MELNFTPDTPDTLFTPSSPRRSPMKLALRKIKGMFLRLSYRVRLRIAYECSLLSAVADLPKNSSMTMVTRLLRLIFKSPVINRGLSSIVSKMLRHPCSLSTSQICGITENSMNKAISFQRELEKVTAVGNAFSESLPDSLKS